MEILFNNNQGDFDLYNAVQQTLEANEKDKETDTNLKGLIYEDFVKETIPDVRKEKENHNLKYSNLLKEKLHEKYEEVQGSLWDESVVPDIRKEKEKLGEICFSSGAESLYCTEQAKCIKEQDMLNKLAGLEPSNKNRVDAVIKEILGDIRDAKDSIIFHTKLLEEHKKTLTALLVEMGYDNIKIDKNSASAIKSNDVAEGDLIWTGEKIWKV